MVIQQLDDGMVKLSNPPKGKVEDERTHRKYKTVICTEQNVKHFKDAE